MIKYTSALACAIMIGSPFSATAKEPAATDQAAIGKRGFFYVGGEYLGPVGKRLMKG